MEKPCCAPKPRILIKYNPIISLATWLSIKPKTKDWYKKVAQEETPTNQMRHLRAELSSTQKRLENSRRFF